MRQSFIPSALAAGLCVCLLAAPLLPCTWAKYQTKIPVGSFTITIENTRVRPSIQLTHTLEGLTASLQEENAAYGLEATDCCILLEPEDGYRLPDSVQVMVNEVLYSAPGTEEEPSPIAYDAENGVLRIPASLLTTDPTLVHLTACGLAEDSPPAEGIEPPTEGADPPAEDTNPPAEGTDPPAEGADPPAEGTDPPTEDTDPPTESTDPPTEDTDPPTEDTDPPVESIEPPAGGTQPPWQETQLPEAAQE